MIKSFIRIVILAFIFIIIFVGGWILSYPDSNDPKNIKYVLWKHGLYRLHIDTVISAMVGDASRNDLIVGKTKTQIQKRFGTLFSPNEVSPYLREAYENFWKGTEVRFIGHSPFMITFDKNGRATDVILMKG
jgi:hypothetical protein